MRGVFVVMVGLVALVTSFTCPGDGFYPDVNDCKKYHWCYFGQYWYMSCPEGTTFSAKFRRCDWGIADCHPPKRLPSWPQDFKWSYNRIPQGYHCIHVKEPRERSYWYDNYFCWKQNRKSPGFRWSHSGPVRNMRCTRVNEPADRYGWHDNYICVPNNSPYKLKWSYAGKIKGQDCIRWYEPSDRHTWNDNYLCGTDKEEPPEPTISPDCVDDWSECRKHPEMCENEEIATLVCQRTCRKCK